LEIVAMEVVNLVGIDINDLHEKYNNAGRKALQFVCGLGPRKAFDFYEKIQHEIITNR
jgi:transcriptional accessory protein Tex/SPT6